MKEKLLEILSLILNELISAAIVGSKAIFILIFGIWFAYFISKRVKKILLKTLKDEMLSGFIAKIALIAIIIIVVVATLGTIGVQTTSIIAALGAAGLAIALALKDSLGNLASGIMLIVFRPFTAKDTVEIGSIVGVIEDISLFHTYMKTPDGKLVVIPNTNIANSTVINYTGKQKGIKTQDIDEKNIVRRIDWLVGVSYDSDIAKTKEIILKAVESTSNIDTGLTEPTNAVFVGVNELQASSIEFIIRAWVLDNNIFVKTKCDMIENVKNALDMAKIEIPYNKLDVNIVK